MTIVKYPHSNPQNAETRARNSEQRAASSDDRKDSRPRIGRAPAESLATPSVDGRFADRFKEYKYVPLECPSCGFEGKVKITMLDRTFHCKECNQQFHVTVRGTVPGKRPPDEHAVGPGAPVELNKPNMVEVWFGYLPRGARWAMLPVAVGAFVLLVLLFRWTRDAPLPRDLPKRAELAGRALALGDLQTLDRMAISDQRKTLQEWYEAVRAKEFEGLTPESELGVTVGELSKLLRRVERVPGKKKKVAVADFRTPVEIALPPDGDDMQLVAQVDMVWVKEDGEWRIDGDWLRDSEQRIVFGPPRPFVPAVPTGDAAEEMLTQDDFEDVNTEDGDAGEAAPNPAAPPPNRPKTALERKRMREAQAMKEFAELQKAQAQKAVEQKNAPPPPPPRKRREN